MPAKCPVCMKQWDFPIQVARHIFGGGDLRHRAWVDKIGQENVLDDGEHFSFDDLLIAQITKPGNIAYETLAEMVAKYQPTDEQVKEYEAARLAGKLKQR